MDPSLSGLLKWGIENSAANSQTSSTPNPREDTRTLNPAAVQALFGGPSEADLMREAMRAITSSEIDRDNKMTAFDNFHMLIEDLNNANNIENISLDGKGESADKRGLWDPLLEQLRHREADMRRMAAWCIGTAVQNNENTQRKLYELNGIPTLVDVSTKDADSAVRQKAIKALSSAVRNYPQALDQTMQYLPEDWKVSASVNAHQMGEVDGMINHMQKRSEEMGSA